MLITGEDEGGFSLDEGKSAEICGADFHQRSDTVVEFGSRPAKRARLLSDSDGPVQEAQVSSFERRGLVQGDFLEESDGDVGGMSEAHQADDPMSEVTNGLLSRRSAGMKVAPLIHACENMQTRLSTRDDETQRGLLNPGTMNGNAGCRAHSMQQDADETISTSGDEAVSVMQVKSPTSKQLRHGRKRSIDQGGPHDSGSIRYDAKSPFITELCTSWKAGAQNEAEMSPDYVDQLDRKQRRSAVTRKVDAKIIGVVGKSEVSNVERTWNVAPVAENGPALCITTDGLKPLIIEGSNQLDLGLFKNGIKEADMERLAGNLRVLPGDIASICTQEDVQATSKPANEVEAAKVIELVTESSAKEASAVGVSDPTGCEDEPGLNPSETLNVYVRKRKRSNTTEMATVDSAVAIEQLASEYSLGERVMKHYVRRPHRQPGSHSLADVIENSSASNGGKENHSSSPRAEHHIIDVSARVETEGNLNVFQRRPKKNHPPQAEHRTSIPAKVEGEGNNLNVFQRRSKKTHSPNVDTSARIEAEGNLNVFHRRSKKNPPPQAEHHSDDVSARVVETEGNVNVFQRSSKMNFPQKEPAGGNDTIVLQNEVNDNHSPAGYVPADHQPNWLPEGWKLEIRQGKSTARPKDKYYHDYKSGRIFRSKNEVLQFLGGDRMRRDQLMLDQGIGMNKVQVQNKERPPVPIVPANKQIGFQSPLSKTSLDGLLLPLAAPSSPCPNGGPVWLPRSGAIGVEQCKGDGTAKDAGTALALHGGASNSSSFLSSGDGVHMPAGSPPVKSPSNQADKGSRGKLIFRLKRKQPDSEGGKGRSKRPMYEVVHVEKASSSSTTSTPTTQEKKLATGERTGQAGAVLPSTPVSMEPHVERISSGKESSLSPNVVVVSGCMPVKAQVLEKHHIPLEKPCPSGPVVMQPTVEQQPTALLKLGLENHNWGIKHNPLQHGSQQLELLRQQEPSYTALGIPATSRSSGLQQMVSYSANHTHVFLDPVHNTIPLSWQYPFTTHVFTTVTTTPSVAPTLGPFPSVPTPGPPLSTRVPVPVFEHFPGVCSSVHLNATATLVPCSEAGVDNDSRKRDSSASNWAKLAEQQGGPQVVHKAPPKSLTKEENTKLLLGLARRLCLAGLEHKKSNLPRLESLTPATNLEGQTKKKKKSSSLQQGVLQATPWMH